MLTYLPKTLNEDLDVKYFNGYAVVICGMLWLLWRMMKLLTVSIVPVTDTSPAISCWRTSAIDKAVEEGWMISFAACSARAVTVIVE